MTDIVERLRATQDDWPACLVVLEQEAADEIERLREALRPLACECVNYCLSLENEGLTFFQDCPRFKARSALEEKE